MSKKQLNPFKDLKLDPYEQEIEDSLDPDTIHKLSDEERKKYAGYAKHTLDLEKKDARLNIRVRQSDLNLIRGKAVENGLPYQTLISTLLHHFATGKVKLRM